MKKIKEIKYNIYGKPYCPNCGKSLDGLINPKYCYECGVKLIKRGFKNDA